MLLGFVDDSSTAQFWLLQQVPMLGGDHLFASGESLEQTSGSRSAFLSAKDVVQRTRRLGSGSLFHGSGVPFDRRCLRRPNHSRSTTACPSRSAHPFGAERSGIRARPASPTSFRADG